MKDIYLSLDVFTGPVGNFGPPRPRKTFITQGTLALACKASANSKHAPLSLPIIDEHIVIIFVTKKVTMAIVWAAKTPLILAFRRRIFVYSFYQQDKTQHLAKYC